MTTLEAKSIPHSLDIGHLKLDGWHIAQTRMEPLCIIHLLKELSNVDFCLLKGLVLFEVHLLRAYDILYQCQQGPFLHEQKEEGV